MTNHATVLIFASIPMFSWSQNTIKILKKRFIVFFNIYVYVYPNFVRKKPQMPPEEATRAVLPLHVLAHQAIQLSRSHVLDFDFLKRVIMEPNTPEFGGFNTKLSREQGQSAQPATRAIYAPLIDMTPADPDTMMTAMVQALKNRH